MESAEWEPIYAAILADFGFDRGADERARDVLTAITEPFAIDRLDCAGARVAIVAGAALDAAAIRRLSAYDHLVATGDALARLEAASLPVRLVVTDLDSDPPRVCARTHRGGIVAVHAHGDNIDRLDAWVTRMERRHVLATTQAAPMDSAVNVGGFTDGDRAAYLAHALDADSLDLVGWDLGDTTVGSVKRRKLDWAARLLTHLETHRDERYAALDGHRRPLPQR